MVMFLFEILFSSSEFWFSNKIDLLSLIKSSSKAELFSFALLLVADLFCSKILELIAPPPCLS